MSQENIELFQKALEGYNRRDIEAMLETWHPEAEWYPFTAQVEGDEVYYGREGLKQWWANGDASFEELEASVDEVRDLGDAVLALGHLRARFRSGVTLDTEIGWLTRYRDGLGVWTRIPKPCRGRRRRRPLGVGDVGGERRDRGAGEGKEADT